MLGQREDLQPLAVPVEHLDLSDRPLAGVGELGRPLGEPRADRLELVG